MKITINTTSTKEIELPLYFQSVQYPDSYFMLVGDKAAIHVKDYPISESLILFPRIEVVSLNDHQSLFQDGINQMSEDHFKLKFIEVTNRIESLLN